MKYSHQKETNRFTIILVMILTGVFGLLCTDIYAPSLPLLPKLFNTTTALIQLTVSLFLLGFAITQLIAGMLSDSYGRKPILILGLIIFSLGTIICIGASSIYVLLIGRMIEGVGAGAISVLSRIILKDIFSGLEMARVGSYLASFIGLSPAIAPVIGGFLQQNFGFRAVFIFLLFYTSIIFYLVLFGFVETNRFKQTLSLKMVFRNYQQALQHPAFLANVIATGCGLSVLIVCAVVNPFLLENTLKITPSHYGICALLAMSGMFIGMLSNGFLVSKIGMRNMMFLGMGVVIASGCSFIVFSLMSFLSIPIVVIFTFLISTAVAFILPNAVVGAFTPFPKIAGTVGAMYGCIQIAITSLVSGGIAMIATPSLFLLGIVMVVLMLISIVSMR